MEPIIINKCTRDKNVLRSFYLYHIFLRPFPLVCGILLVLVAGLVIPSLIKGNVYAIIWTVVVLLYVGYKIMQYRSSVKYIFARECKLNSGKPLTVTLMLYESFMVQRTDLTPDVKIPYSTIRSVRRWKDTLYIINSSRQAFILRDEDYLKGSSAELKELLARDKERRTAEKR